MRARWTDPLVSIVVTRGTPVVSHGPLRGEKEHDEHIVPLDSTRESDPPRTQLVVFSHREK